MATTTGMAPPAPETPESAVHAPRPEVRSRHDAVRVIGLVAAFALLGVAVLASLLLGSRSIALGTTWHVLWSPDGSAESVIIHDLRIPRTLLGLLVGGALGLSGALMQAVTLNPLAEPGLLGVNLGAATGVVVAIAYLGITTVGGYIGFAFLGAALTSVAVFLLGGTGRQPTPERQVLAGIAITSVLGAFVWGVLVTKRDAFDRYRHWDVGSLGDREAGVIGQVWIFIVAGAIVALLLGRSLNAMALGDESAAAMGASPVRTRIWGFVAVTLLCGAATAAAGPIWFLGLAVPHAARLVTGPDYRWVLTYSLVLAPAVLLLADVIGRLVVTPSELEVGIVTAFLGAPVFLALCRRRRIATL